LRRRLLVDALIGRLRDPAVGAAIGIERPEQAMRPITSPNAWKVDIVPSSDTDRLDP
jgi:hypothetical protein